MVCFDSITTTFKSYYVEKTFYQTSKEFLDLYLTGIVKVKIHILVLFTFVQMKRSISLYVYRVLGFFDFFLGLLESNDVRVNDGVRLVHKVVCTC